MANVEIKVFENISIKEKIVFEKFIDENWGEDKLSFLAVPRLWVVGYRKNKTVGMFCVFDDVNMGRIDRVVTRSDCRRTGIMSQMLRKFFGEIVEKYNFDMAILETDLRKTGKLFGRIGFMVVAGGDKEKTVMVLGLKNKNAVAKFLML